MAVRTIVTFRRGCPPSGMRDMNLYLRTFGSGTHNFVRAGSRVTLYLRDEDDLNLMEGQFAPMIERVTRLLGKEQPDGSANTDAAC